MKRLMLAAFITASLVLGTITAKAEGLWAAIVFEEVQDRYCGGRNEGKLGAYGIAWKHETEMAARLAAKAGCEEHTPFCHHEYGFSTQERCLVLVVQTRDSTCRGVKTRAYREGLGDTADEAEEDACSDAWKYGRDCEVRFNTCRR